MVRHGVSPAVLDSLKSLEDVGYPRWQLKNPLPEANYHHQRRHRVNTEDPDRIRKNLREEPEGIAWPGDSLDPDSDAGMAILGSVHGRSLACFLIQHKQQFGDKIFKSISLFRRNEWRKEDKVSAL